MAVAGHHEMTADSRAFDAGREAGRRLRHEDKGRFLCAMLAPAQHRDPLLALYNFNLEIARVRRTVSEPMIGQLRLKWWYDALDKMSGGVSPKHPICEALSAVSDKYGINLAALQRLIEVRADDLVPEQPENQLGLAEIARETDGVLGTAALKILGVGDAAAAAQAVEHLSAAQVFTALMLMLPSHAAQGWLYLPADVCSGANLDPVDALRTRYNRPSPPELCAAVREIAENASAHLKAARALRAQCPSQALPVLLHAVLVEHQLKRLRACKFDPALLSAHTPGPGPMAMLRLGWHAFRRRY